MTNMSVGEKDGDSTNTLSENEMPKTETKRTATTKRKASHMSDANCDAEIEEIDKLTQNKKSQTKVPNNTTRPANPIRDTNVGSDAAQQTAVRQETQSPPQLATTNHLLNLPIEPTPIAGVLPRATDADVDVAPHAPYASTSSRQSKGLGV
jgi:hypothetical protein